MSKLQNFIFSHFVSCYRLSEEDILETERRSESMNEETKETVLKVADYSNEEKKKLSRRMCILFSAGAVLFTFYVVAEMCFEGVHNELLDFCEGFTLGFSYSVMIGGILYTSGCLAKIKAFKKRIMGK